MGKLITKQQIIDEAKKLIAEFPEKCNPVDSESGTCVYTDKDGSHCFAGQILVNLGLPIPQFGDKCNFWLINTFIGWELSSNFSMGAKTALACLQAQADNGTKSSQVLWGEIDISRVEGGDTRV